MDTTIQLGKIFSYIYLDQGFAFKRPLKQFLNCSHITTAHYRPEINLPGAVNTCAQFGNKKNRLRGAFLITFQNKWLEATAFYEC
jgi:hypothetical protein